MATILNKVKILLNNVIEEPSYFCNSITTRYKYNNGQRTDEIAGYVYTATNIDTYDQIHVLVEGKKPLMSPEKLENLQEQGEKTFVEFINAVIKPYYSERTKSIEDSIRADEVKLVETN